jgi:hypothetical protein
MAARSIVARRPALIRENPDRPGNGQAAQGPAILRRSSMNPGKITRTGASRHT